MEEQLDQLKEEIEINIQNKDYGLVRNNYLDISFIFKSQKNQIERLRYLLLTIYMDLSGMSNNNTIEEYDLLDWVFETTLWKEISIAKKKSKFDDENLLNLLSESVLKFITFLPFSYFNVDVIGKIIIDKLNGEENLLNKYKQYKNIPELNSSNYNYTEITIKKAREERALDKRLEEESERYMARVEKFENIAPLEREKGISLTIIPQNYTVVDLETTGFSTRYNDIIEIGCIKIRDGEIVDKYQTLVKPPDPIPYFIECMTGIKNEMVADAPSFIEISQSVWDFLKDEIIVGHNVSFDINFLYDNFFNTFGKKFKNDWVDTLRLSRKIVRGIRRHGLMELCSYFSVTIESLDNETFLHHRAINDCLLANGVLKGLAIKIKEENLDLKELFKKNAYDFKNIQGDKNLFNEDHIFYEKNCVFTGKLERFMRTEAVQIVANIGGHCENNVTKNTNFLIVGDMDYKEGLNGYKSNKLKKAEELIKKGQDLKILPESAFYDLVADYINNEGEKNECQSEEKVI